MNHPLMKCGHAANSTSNGKPSCVICAGIIKDNEVIDQIVDLTGRFAKCAYGGSVVPSSMDLAFFEYRPNEKEDIYYCGCYGWD